MLFCSTINRGSFEPDLNSMERTLLCVRLNFWHSPLCSPLLLLAQFWLKKLLCLLKLLLQQLLLQKPLLLLRLLTRPMLRSMPRSITTPRRLLLLLKPLLRLLSKPRLISRKTKKPPRLGRPRGGFFVHKGQFRVKVDKSAKNNENTPRFIGTCLRSRMSRRKCDFSEE